MASVIQPLLLMLFIFLGISFGYINWTLANQHDLIEKIYEMLAKEGKNP